MLKTTRGKKIPWEQSQERSNPVLATPTSPHAGFWSPRRSHCSCLSSPHSVCSRGLLTKATSQRGVHFSSCGQHAGPVSSLAPPSFRLSPPCPAPGFVPHLLPRDQCAGADSGSMLPSPPTAQFLVFPGAIAPARPLTRPRPKDFRFSFPRAISFRHGAEGWQQDAAPSVSFRRSSVNLRFTAPLPPGIGVAVDLLIPTVGPSL